MIKIRTDSSKWLRKTKNILDKGGLVALPTETVWGIAARADHSAAVRALYRAKRRSRYHPFLLAVAGVESLNSMKISVSKLELKLLEAFWPGPLSLLLNNASKHYSAASAFLPKIGWRCPSVKYLQLLLSELEYPLALPSANISGLPELSSSKEIENIFAGIVDAVVEKPKGLSMKGQASTLVEVSDNNKIKVLREGALSENEICSILN